jgi:hypothetical protein
MGRISVQGLLWDDLHDSWFSPTPR